ncbi:28 kDa heat- and acid-stable phosphoprotein-like [Homarus americanus]|uniref:28 kDa heat- and acid-stable phosphoprotein-like n=1 Tax=Homarus americanus TaxID=6706 RepID=UPI001C44EA95|nr:28 kDa heat- and acid-stable phosphoprotein-like [Homarus americanus]
MPKGKHKGGRRQFTNFEAMEAQKKKEEKERQWRKEQGEETDSDEEKEKSGSSSSSEESSSEEGEVKELKAKGVGGLIECENPNRVASKPKKVTTINTTATGSGGASSTAKPHLSRREREEIEKQRATAHYRKLHAEGKTDEARADLARLALIRQQREDAAKKKEDERKAREAAATAKRDQMAKALNKKKS